MDKKDFFQALKYVLSSKIDFEEIKYVEIRNEELNKDVMVLRLITGDAFTFDVTGYSNERIYHTLALLECGQVPKNRISNTAELIEIGLQAKSWGSVIC